MKKAVVLIIITILFSGISKAQEKTTMNVKDLDSGIEKYVKKNFESYKITEAFKYEVVFQVKIEKGSESEKLVFDREGAFLYKMTEADKAKVSLQTRSTMATKDVESGITKYIKKNFEGYKITEAFKYDEVYTTKIMKGADSEMLVFDKDGEFVMKAAPKPVESTKKADSLPVKKEEIKKTDTTKK
jgi:uncharacterized protein YlbG (UPF0298 family)